MSIVSEKAIADAIAAFSAGQHPSGATLEQRMEAAILAALPSKGEPEFWAVHSKTGMHIGLWPYKGHAEEALREYEGGSITPLFLAPPAPAVAIKPLEWRPHGSERYPEWTAVGAFGFTANIDKSMAACFGLYPLKINGCWDHKYHDTIDESKAAARADYEARIRSALVSAPPVDPVKEKMAAACKMVTERFGPTRHDLIFSKRMAVDECFDAVANYEAEKAGK